MSHTSFPSFLEDADDEDDFDSTSVRVTGASFSKVNILAGVEDDDEYEDDEEDEDEEEPYRYLKGEGKYEDDFADDEEGFV